MPTQKIEPAAAGFTMFAATGSLLADVLNWMSQNMAAISALAIIGGFCIQLWSSCRNKAKSDAEEARAQAEEARAQAEEKRAQEEHEIRMAIKRAILNGEIPECRDDLLDKKS